MQSGSETLAKHVTLAGVAIDDHAAQEADRADEETGERDAAESDDGKAGNAVLADGEIDEQEVQNSGEAEAERDNGVDEDVEAFVLEV